MQRRRRVSTVPADHESIVHYMAVMSRSEDLQVPSGTEQTARLSSTRRRASSATRISDLACSGRRRHPYWSAKAAAPLLRQAEPRSNVPAARTNPVKSESLCVNHTLLERGVPSRSVLSLAGARRRRQDRTSASISVVSSESTCHTR